MTQAYNLSQLANKVNTSGQVDVATGITGTVPIANGGTGTTSTTYCNLASNVTGTLPVARGGTGAATLTANNVLLGNGTSAVQVVAPGTSGNILTSNGTTWTSGAGNFVSKDVGNLGVGMFAVGYPTSGSTTAGNTASIYVYNLRNTEAGLGAQSLSVTGTWRNVGSQTAYFDDPTFGTLSSMFQRIS